jgi:hypothetical protein
MGPLTRRRDAFRAKLTQVPFQPLVLRQYIDINWDGYDLTRKSFSRLSKVTNGRKTKGRRTARRPFSTVN